MLNSIHAIAFLNFSLVAFLPNFKRSKNEFSIFFLPAQFDKARPEILNAPFQLEVLNTNYTGLKSDTIQFDKKSEISVSEITENEQHHGKFIPAEVEERCGVRKHQCIAKLAYLFALGKFVKLLRSFVTVRHFSKVSTDLSSAACKPALAALG